MANTTAFYFNVSTKIHDHDSFPFDGDEEEDFNWSENAELEIGGGQRTYEKTFIVDNEVQLNLYLTFSVFLNEAVATSIKYDFYEGDSNGKDLKKTDIIEPLVVGRGVKAPIVRLRNIGDDEGDWFNLTVEVINKNPPPVQNTPQATTLSLRNDSLNVSESTAYPVMNKMGAIYLKWQTLGGKNGFLSNPISAESICPDNNGYFVHFQGGSIYWTFETGAFEVHGDIRNKWESLNWEKGHLGYPLTDETTTPDGIGKFTHFQGGSIYWSPQTSAFEIHGAIRDKWASLGWENSFLGYPLTDETTCPDGSGKFNHFQGGSIYWSPQTGAFEIHGAIRDKWASLGWENSFLGYPISDELTEADGITKISKFQGGTITWTPNGGAQSHINMFGNGGVIRNAPRLVNQLQGTSPNPD